jgi:hypothetical protein
MKTVYSYQEIGTLIDQGKRVLFTCHPEARVTAVQQDRDSDSITVTLNLSIRDRCIGNVEYEYDSIVAVFEAFDRDDLEEMWEVLNGDRDDE